MSIFGDHGRDDGFAEEVIMKHLWIGLLCVTLLTGCGWIHQSGQPDATATATPAVASPTPGVSGYAATGPDGTAPAVSPNGVDSGQSGYSPTANGKPIDPTKPAMDYRVIGKPEVVAAVMLMVNGKVITVNEVLHPARRRLLRLGKGGSEAQFRGLARGVLAEEIRQQIGQSLVYTEADRRLGEQEKAYVDGQMNGHLRDMIAAAGGSRTRLVQRFKDEGFTLEEWLSARRRQEISDLYMRQKLVPHLHITRQKLWRYYQEHKADYTKTRMVKMQLAAFSFRRFYPEGVAAPSQTERAAAKAKAIETANQALKDILAGKDFGEVVKALAPSIAYRSDQGGVWDFVPAGSLREKKVEDTAFELPKGAVSGVIEGETGMFIVKAMDHQTGEVTSFEKAQPGIEDKLRQQQYEKLRMEYFHKLTLKATIVQAEAFEKFALDRAVQKYFKQ